MEDALPTVLELVAVEGLSFIGEPSDSEEGDS